MAGTAYQKARLAVCSMISSAATPESGCIDFRLPSLAHCWITPVHIWKPKSKYIARTFGAESYMVTNGTSTSNKIVGMVCRPAGSTLLIDRNCHKSLAHLLMSDVVPLWLSPTRNALGILRGIRAVNSPIQP